MCFADSLASEFTTSKLVHLKALLQQRFVRLNSHEFVSKRFLQLVMLYIYVGICRDSFQFYGKMLPLADHVVDHCDALLQCMYFPWET